jgi:hypothetical protein
MSVTINGSGQTVVQVVNATISAAVSTSSASYSSTGLTATITPSSASSKIFILMNSDGGQQYSGRSSFYAIYRGGSSITSYQAFLNTVSVLPISMTYLDSPATTSATTYTIYFAADGLGPTYFSGSSGGYNVTSTLTLMEISGS